MKEFDVINTVVIGLGNMGKKHYDNLIINDNFNVIGYIDIIDKT